MCFVAGRTYVAVLTSTSTSPLQTTEMAETKMNPEEAITEEEIFNQDAPRKKPKVVNACESRLRISVPNANLE